VGLGHIGSSDCARSGESNGRKYGNSGVDLGSGCFSGITYLFLVGNGIETKIIYCKM
jgi:hypothetical protein